MKAIEVYYSLAVAYRLKNMYGECLCCIRYYSFYQSVTIPYNSYNVGTKSYLLPVNITICILTVI